MADLTRSLTMLIFGNSKSGKTVLSSTSPAPRLILDVENGTKFLDVKAVGWNPLHEEPPSADESWDTCIVHVREYSVVARTYQWLLSGKHPFKSVVIDSISELQAKALEDIAGRDQMKTQDWGSLLREMAGFMRDMRDLTIHPTNPLECVVLTAMGKEDMQGRMVPYLQGQAATIAPYIFDVTGYLTVETFPHPDPAMGKYTARRLYVCCTDVAVCGERVAGRLGEIVEQDDLNIQTMIDKVYGQESPAAVTAEESSV